MPLQILVTAAAAVLALVVVLVAQLETEDQES
jgi:hypothetical protein